MVTKYRPQIHFWEGEKAAYPTSYVDVLDNIITEKEFKDYPGDHIEKFNINDLPETNLSMFDVIIPANRQEYKVVFETLLTTNNSGGMNHSFVIE